VLASLATGWEVATENLTTPSIEFLDADRAIKIDSMGIPIWHSDAWGRLTGIVGIDADGVVVKDQLRGIFNTDFSRFPIESSIIDCLVSPGFSWPMSGTTLDIVSAHFKNISRLIA
jgi:hypothetical protein